MPPKPSKPKQQTLLPGLKGSSRKPNSPPPSQIHPFNIPFEGKSIVCERHGPNQSPPTLIFTHGAGGGIQNPATRSFVEGAARRGGSVVCFQGTMNLQARTKAFCAVVEHEKQAGKAEQVAAALGGRSMGARAAVLAAAAERETTHLVLVSYPLVGQNGSVRDEILLEIGEDVKVLFVSGDGDNMCDIRQLNGVRGKMKARSWLAVVKGADHGMGLKPKEAVEVMRRYTGEVAARWIEGCDEGRTECVLRWDAHGREVVDEGWKAPSQEASITKKSSPSKEEEKEEVTGDAEQRSAKRQRKR